MKITEKENMLLRRALDPASSPNEAEAAMAAFARSLRKRGINGYDFVPPDREARPQGPQARPSDTPQPEPPKAEPPPPYQQTYAERAYKEASKPEPEPTPPAERESKFGRWIATCLYGFGFWAVVFLFSAVGKGCHPINIPGAIYAWPMPGPAPQQVGSSTNPYKIEWREKGWLKRWQALPYGSYYNDRHGKPTQKLSAELPVADVFVDVPGGFADEEEALAAVPLGCPSLPYRINWSAADAYEHFKNVPSYSFYVDWDGSIKQKP